MPNTCKSNEEPLYSYKGFLSGERVSNTLVTCPEDRDNSSKGLLIPDMVLRVRYLLIKGSNSLREGPAAHQLVGRVMAYQGDDG